MANAQIESDPLFQLLTDALRAGPQSPEWAQAVAKVREGGAGGADEYKLLLQAREDLESGREYKAVRAGAEFTRELFGKIEEEKDGRRGKGLPTATLLAVGAGVVIVGVIGLVAFLIGRGPTDRKTGPETLPTLFADEMLVAKLVPAELDEQLDVVGDLPIEVADGTAKPGKAAGGEPGSYVTGELWMPKRVPADRRFEFEAEVVPSPKGKTITQVYVHDGPPLTGKELIWTLAGGDQRVMLAEATQKAGPLAGDGPVTVRLVVGATRAAVYANKELLWAGDHTMSAGQKVVGVRFLRPAGDETPVPAVKAFRVRAEAAK